MQDDAAFVRAIASAPHDHAPRLIYADWLEERNDPRSELIRVQTAIDLQPHYTEEFARLKTRRNALWAITDPEWLRAMGYVPTHRPLFTKLPDSRLERWRLVEEFLDLWHPTAGPDMRFEESKLTEVEDGLGSRLPDALREWYGLIAKRGNPWTRQDHLDEPMNLRVEKDALVIRYENQSCEWWGIKTSDLELSDPPVHELLEGRLSSASTTAFAIQTLLYETKFARGLVQLWGEVSLEALATLNCPQLQICDLPTQYWVGSPIHFREGTDLLVETHVDQWVYVTARNEEALTQLEPLLLEQLERSDS